MPFTFAHPAAVLPLRKYCPKFLNLPALMAGSISPDLGYYFHNWIWSVAGHSFLGSMKFDIPVGLILTALFYLCIRPIARLLPYPHREACHAICPVVRLPGLRAVLVAAVSVLMGAWTHIIWDGFTHANGWCVRQFSASTPALFMLGTYKVTVWHLLQHGSTLFGLSCLFMAYQRYAYGKRFLKERSLLSQRASIAVLILLTIPPAVFAISRNASLLNGHFNIPGLDEFSYNATLAYVCVFLPLASAAGVLLSLLEYLFLPPILPPGLPSLSTSDLQPEAKPVSSLSSRELVPMSMTAPELPTLPAEILSQK